VPKDWLKNKFGNTMQSKNINPPIAVGMGHVCLDALYDEDHETYLFFAGGSCVNVLSILQSRGWQTHPIGYIGQDPAAEYVFDDLAEVGTNASHIFQSSKTQTPIYVQTFAEDGHIFKPQCPFCQKNFKRFEPMPMDYLPTLERDLPSQANVYYYDRVTESALALARKYKPHALMYFEPNRYDDEQLFRDSLQLADIVKYSNEKMHHAQPITAQYSYMIEIETCGKEGVRFRLPQSSRKEEWYTVPAQDVELLLDAAGSGDWLSASILEQVQKFDKYSLVDDPQSWKQILTQGQQESALNCAVYGARGRMYDGKTIRMGKDFCPYCALKS
jgi:fructokinase